MVILQDRLSYLQRLLDAVGNGYRWYFIGACAAQKVDALVKKFDREYETGLSKSTRCRRRAGGEAVTLAYGYRLPSNDLRFCLLVTDGVGRIHTREALENIERKRIEDGDLELVHDGVAWTWRLRLAVYNRFRERIHSAAALPPSRRGLAVGPDGNYDPAAEKLLDELYHLPGFRLVRRQVGHLVHFLIAEWRRLRPASDPLPTPRKFLPYMQRRAN